MKLVCVVGPTGCGKTWLGVELAKMLGGEVVSCDSMQIYRGMVIGTAAPTAEEMQGVPHHMVGVADTRENYSDARYAADAAESVVKLFDGKIVYINVMKNMSVDCDCCAVAEDPCMKDIGILASLDPIAIDQACLDLVYASDDPGRDHLVERIESRNGVHTVEAAAELGFGSREYELIEL